MVRVTDDGWDALVRDLGARVAVYDPDWTHANQHDPGVTIVELFAFLGESMLYRSERVPGLRARLLAEFARLEHLADPDCDDATLVRPRYFTGQLLTADDLAQEQDYQRAKHRRHNRLLHGTGVISGFDVSVEGAGKGGKPAIVVSPGVAIDPYGEELVLCERMTVRLPPRATACYVCVRLAERAAGAGPDGEATRVEESAEVVVLAEVPAGAIPIGRLVREHGTWHPDGTFQPPRAPR